MGELADADAVAEVLTHVTADAALVAALGGTDHISGRIEGPWPHLVIEPGFGGDLRDLLSSVEPDVNVSVIGPPDETVGSAALWRLTMQTLASIRRMPDRDHQPGRAVVSNVRLTGGLTKQPLTSGQTRWQATVNVTISPPQD